MDSGGSSRVQRSSFEPPLLSLRRTWLKIAYLFAIHVSSNIHALVDQVRVWGEILFFFLNFFFSFFFFLFFFFIPFYFIFNFLLIFKSWDGDGLSPLTTPFFSSRFASITDRKVPSEVVVMGLTGYVHMCSEKKRFFLRSTNFDHLPLCGLGD